MTYLIATYWLPLLLSLAVGAFVGLRSFTPANGGWWPRAFPLWFKVLLGVIVVGVVFAFFTWLPRRFGLVLETALLFLIAYVIGCFLGAYFAGSKTAEAPVAAAKPVVVTPPPAPVPAPVAPSPAPVVAVEPVAAEEPVVAPVDEPVEEPAVAPIPAAPALRTGESEEAHPGFRPQGVIAASGAPDDLKRILGIGPVNERKLNELGIWHFHQIAAWTPENAEWVGSYLAFKGRIEREDWIGQSKLLAQGLETEHSRKVDRGEIPG